MLSASRAVAQVCAYCSRAGALVVDHDGDLVCAPGVGCAVSKRRAPVAVTRLAPEPAQHAPELAVVVRWPRASVRPCVTPLCGRARAGTSTRCERCKRLERGRP